MRNVVIIGGGFGGLTAARALKNAPVNLTLIDQRNHHLFQPLLYQVATAGLSPAEIAAPIRSVLRSQRNAEVIMAEVTGVDRERKVVKLGPAREVPFDDLVIATGSSYNYFGHEDWEAAAPAPKSIESATRIRQRILRGFEHAETEKDPEKGAAELTFVLVGAGPTGVEMSGSIAELAHQALRSDFRHIHPESARIILIEAGPRILAAFPEKLATDAARYLAKRGVEIRTDARVEKVDCDGVIVSGQRIAAKTVIWAAGVVASPAGKWLGAGMDRAGRVIVNPDLTVPGSPDIFVIGDTASVTQDGKLLPGLAPVAIQQGRYVARCIEERAEAAARAPEDAQLTLAPFHYRDKGNLATVGRSFAVVDLGWIRLSGFLAWLTWLVVHIYYLIGFRNRIIVMLDWFWAYVSFQRGARLIVREDEECS